MHPTGSEMTKIKTPITSRYVQKINRYMQLGAEGKLEELWGEVRPLFMYVTFRLARVNTCHLVHPVQNGPFRVNFRTNLLSCSDFSTGNTQWFCDGFLNVCYNCVDRHAIQNPNKVSSFMHA